jgi:transposase
MLAFSANARIFLYQISVDMRKGFEGLTALVEIGFSEPLASGAYFVFLNKKRDRMKILYFDIDGLVIWHKRLEKGSFPKRQTVGGLIERKEFLMLLEGVTPKRIQKRFKIS